MAKEKPLEDRIAALEAGFGSTRQLLEGLAGAVADGHTLRTYAPIADLFPPSPETGSPDNETTVGTAE